jgi:hypothetical protein
MGQPRTLRRRWIAAGLVSLAAHALVFLGLSMTPREGPPAPTPPVLITLERLERPTPPKARPTTSSAPPNPRPNPFRLHQPPAAPTAVSNSGLSPGASSAPPAPGAPSAAPPQQAATVPPLKLDCLHLGPAARTGVFGREDCEARRYQKLANGDGGYAIPENPEWEAQISRQQSKHRPLPPEKPSRNDCANSNLGLGCTDGMLVPLVKRKF